MISARRTTVAAVIALVVCVIAPTLAFAHAVVYPKTSTAGGYERYVLRVPNEKALPTTRVEIHFPADLRVTAFADVPGWTLQVTTDSAKRIIGAVWTGSLPPQRFIEFPFVGANPKTETKLVWSTYQTYDDTLRVEWTGAEGTKTPASVTTIGPAASKDAAPAGTSTPMSWLPWAAIALSLVSLGFSLRRPAQP